MIGEFNIAALVMERARQFPERIALRGPEDDISYADLGDFILSFASRMRHGGIGRSCAVAIDTDNAFIAVAATLAAALLGCGWVHGTKAAVAHRALGLTHVVHDGAWLDSAGENYLRVRQDWFRPASEAEAAEARFAGFASPEDTWMIAQSSGTTGTSKFMAISEANAWRRVAAGLPDLRGETPVVCSLQHPLTLGSVFNILRVLVAGGTFIFVRDYEFWAENGVNYVIGSPAQFAGFFQTAPRPPRPRVYLAMLAGGPILPNFLGIAFDYFEAVLNTYGSTEAAIICAKIATRGDEIEEQVCLGPAASGTVLEIVDEGGNRLPAGSEGIVRLKTPWQVPAYIGDSETTAATFRDGWFYPGDFGHLSREGELRISGRTNDQLNIGGTKLNPAILDEIIQGTAGVTDGICFAEPNPQGVPELSAVIAIAAGADPAAIAGALRQGIRAKLGRSAVPSRIYVSQSVPRNMNGKATRHLAAEAVKGITPV